MITFLICLAMLIVAYFTYGKFLEKVCGIDSKAKVPSETLYDGVVYIPMPRWRTFLIQLLNIAGVGPIFGAIMGACYGPVAFLWITLGGIFLGAMHDNISAVISLRHGGLSIPEIIGIYLGDKAKFVLRIFSIVVLILVGAVFVRTPATLLDGMFESIGLWWWIGVIIVYYFIATLLPIDKLIGKIYPIFGAALIFMALGLLYIILFGDYTVPELSEIRNHHFNAANLPLIPMLCITIACGAISGFHATQSPLMARCVNNEKECRSVFYGAMITESIIALIWAAIAMAFFGGVDSLQEALAAHGNNAGWAVDHIANTTLGIAGGLLALLGVVAAPITSGDTAFRSARLIVADIFHIDQRNIVKRLAVSSVLFAIGVSLLFINFDILWRYFAWSNQTLSVFVLWSITVYLYKKGGLTYWLALLPALFMTYICSSYIFISKTEFIGMENRTLAYILGGVVTLVIAALATLKFRRDDKIKA